MEYKTFDNERLEKIININKDEYFLKSNGIKDYLVDDKLDNSILFFHGIIPPEKDEDKDYKFRLKTLRTILKTGLIASENVMRNSYYWDTYYSRDKKNSYDFNRPNFVSLAIYDQYYGLYENGKNYILRNYLYDLDSFAKYISNNLSIIIDPFVAREKNNNPSSTNRLIMKGEFQILDYIEKCYFLGIALPNNFSSSIISKIVEQEEQPLKNETINDFRTLNEEELINKYFYLQNEIENILKEQNYELDLFNIYSGEKINSTEKELKKINKIIN